MWITIIRSLLGVVIALVKARSDHEQQQIGADAVIKEQLVGLAKSVGIAKEVSVASRNWDADTVDSILRNYNRENRGDSHQ